VIGFVLISLATLLAEWTRRQELAVQAKADDSSYVQRFAEMARLLRAEFHPKQRRLCESRAKRRWGLCTRRAGKTRGLLREIMARCLEGRQRWIYCAATRKEAKARAWKTDSRDGWLDLIEQLGLRIAKTSAEFERDRRFDCVIDRTELMIDFRNGSQLSIFAADRAEDADKLRGGQKDGVWIDEAQIFPALTYFVDEVCDALVKQANGEEGEIILTGTPSRTLSGLFYEASKPADHGERVPGWEGHQFSVVDNPFFGRTEQERWDNTAGKTLRTKGWDIDDPPPAFVREWLGQWTKGDALYVYAVHARPPHEFAPNRVNAATGYYDHALALSDLPEYVLDEDGRRIRIRWFFALGADFGTSPAAFAWTLWAFSPDIADIYEMGSWKCHDLKPRQIKAALVHVWKQCAERLAVCVGDAGGALAKASLEGWQESTGLPIEPADKLGKVTWIEHFNGELFSSNVHYREESALLAEQRELQWRPGKAKPGETDVDVKLEEWPERLTSDGTRCGNDVCDSALYPYRHLIARRLEFAKGPASTLEERIAREEARLLQAAVDSTRRALSNEHAYEN